MNEIEVKIDENGVALVIFDDPERPVNTWTPDLLVEIEHKLIPLIEDSGVKAMVLASGKSDNFIAGADIKFLGQVDEPDSIKRIDRGYSWVLTRLAENYKPVVAAVHGAALGGGLETVLACRYIIATDHPVTVLGLPEVQLGILPAAGGTQRLPKRVGLFKGIEMMLSGRRIAARKALKFGLVDEVAAPEKLRERAVEVALALAEGRMQPRRRQKNMMEMLMHLPPCRFIILGKIRKRVRKKSGNHYPSPYKIIDCVEKGLKDGMDAALKMEVECLGELAMTNVSKSLVWLFLASQELKTSGNRTRSPEQVAVVGSGLMGSGIASNTVNICPVVVQDISQEPLDKCKTLIQKDAERRLNAELITGFEFDRRLGAIKTTRDIQEISKADIIIEAVYEDLKLKQKVLARAEEIISPNAVFASCTSALPISEIAGNARHPERVLGMHYFSPVYKMPLLELISTDHTSDETIGMAKALASSQGKTVIQVKDGPGFYTTRILTSYLREALLLLAEGARIDDVDRAMKVFGFPVGPLTLMDEIGIDVAARVGHTLGKAYAGRWFPCDTASRLSNAGFRGRKNQTGFYRYSKKDDSRKQVNRKVYSFFSDTIDQPVSVSQIKERLVLIMINEAALCLQEDVISSARDGDIGAVMGLGYPPFRGGPFHYVDTRGPGDIVAGLEQMARRDRTRFQPAQILVDMAHHSKKFFK